jgi:predicted DNA-binding transcriptional regulator YafY
MYDNFLKTSMEGHKAINIMYMKNTEITQRKIKVLKIKDNDIEAYCYLRHGIRHFRKDNILAVEYTQ